ncbi:MAG: peptidoglycan-binding protein [Bradyrhizobium sp.]|nr:MAG: peptidoglycan-binding protein [Bradyrhizobium sp.]
MPRRRRGASAVAIETEAERGLVMRVLLYSPKDLVAGALGFAAVSAIVANALLLQTGPHPSPMFGAAVAVSAAVTPASPLPRPRPVEAAPKPADALPLELKPAESKASDALTSLVKATSATSVAPPTIVRPPAPIPVVSSAFSGSRRVAAVQRTLTEYGYGQLKPTGTIGADTQAAIQKFERDRKIPVTGQMSDRLVRELTAMVGHPID